MQKAILLLAAGTLSLGATAASALEWTYGHAELRYRNFDSSSTSLTTTNATGTVEARHGNVTLGFNVNWMGAEGDNIYYYGASLGYDITPAFTAFLDIDAVTTSFGSGSDTFASYTLGGEYRFDAVTLGAALGYAPDANDDLAYALYGSYTVSPQLEFYASAGTDFDTTDITYVLGAEYTGSRVSLDAVLFAAPDDDITLLSVDGKYYFGLNSGVDLRVGGKLGLIDFSGDTVTSVGVSGGVQIVDNLWLDAGIALADSSASSDNVTIFSLGLEYEFGKRTRLRDRIQDAQRDALFDFAF